ncbi:MAG: TetR/AcrR family transcriptional regulator [Verrucomicrobiales bacterium]|nr:TetR/AcrR family transcriptional regulator [Verrucomicrobiales bacterium]
MITENSKPQKRGRPPGRTSEGETMRRRLYEAAISLIGQRGYEGATLREVAVQVGVSPALLYRYFPSKRAVVLALYDELSVAFAREAEAMPEGRWRDRFLYALELSLQVLGPHRTSLRALTPTMVGDADEGIFAQTTAFSRQRVQGVFEAAMTGAKDAPKPAVAEALGRLLYLGHLGVILWWLLDRSPGQRATRGLVELLRQILPSAALALRLPLVRRFVESANSLFQDALLANPGEADPRPSSTIVPSHPAI